jgi:hypothetical protein
VQHWACGWRINRNGTDGNQHSSRNKLQWRYTLLLIYWWRLIWVTNMFQLTIPTGFSWPRLSPSGGLCQAIGGRMRDALSQRQMISMFRHRTIGTIWYYWFLRMGARLQHHNVPM